MNKEIDLKNYTIRTDLIEESLTDFNDNKNIKREEFIKEDIKIYHAEVLDNIKGFNRKKGKYITISFDDVTDNNNFNKVYKVFKYELKNLIDSLNLKEDYKVLVVGLGNSNSTPDSLGVKVSENILVTRHLFVLDEVSVSPGFKNMSSFSPNVMGNTGIEALDIIKGVIDNIDIDLIIVIDSLASSSIDRLNKTIQITDTGISPGSGIGNYRKEISEESLNKKVIAVGVPTVVDAVTIVSDTIDFLMKKVSYNKENIDKPQTKLKLSTMDNYLKKEIKENLSHEEKQQLLGMMGTLNEEDMKSLIFEVLTPIGYNMMVTPKEVDFLIDRLSILISKGINNTIHTLDKEI